MFVERVVDLLPAFVDDDDGVRSNVKLGFGDIVDIRQKLLQAVAGGVADLLQRIELDLAIAPQRS